MDISSLAGTGQAVGAVIVVATSAYVVVRGMARSNGSKEEQLAKEKQLVKEKLRRQLDLALKVSDLAKRDRLLAKIYFEASKNGFDSIADEALNGLSSSDERDRIISQDCDLV